ncbi:mammalian cell entry protein [Mycobacterium saskatchewanense]|uniref:Mammalian cell entry protein n=1 Tax=Mycobacterium saskatchewanense TaxID=220927 RepID=A0AAJ3TWC5_9MYCO|nr:MlaD family protein [Mycobacterium saskatchewanense]ORW73698.1 mammalian cell entry protein [Mycobacterium saskatchewanense]BBX65153.1 mammalian cell entry protein [Mycobacterium saskatchewanense]
MRLTKRIIVQLAIFGLVAVVAAAVMGFGYMRLPETLFGVGRYTVTVDLPSTGGLYARSNVTYRGTEVGRVESVQLSQTGVHAQLSLRSDVRIPSDLDAQVHSQSAIGEQYITLLPRNATSAPLKNGDVIPQSRTSVPPDINDLLGATNRGLQAIPQQNLKVAIDESYTAFAGLGPDIARLIKGASSLAIDARSNLDPLVALIDQSKPILDSQTDTADSVQGWATHLAAITQSLQKHDVAVGGVLRDAGSAAEQVRALLDRVQPTLPVLLANLVSINRVAIAYRPDLEQLLVLLPEGTQVIQGANVANRNTKQPYHGGFLSFNLNLNIPPACTTGFLPATQQRPPAAVDYPERPPGDLYCRVPQDAPFNVRGARNIPCETVPGKRAPTAKMCESAETYVPLNDGYNWKGDPNGTLSGQDIPQLASGQSPAAAAPPGPVPPPLAVSGYDPATGVYIGPDGKLSTQSDLAPQGGSKSWETMLLPPQAH